MQYRDGFNKRASYTRGKIYLDSIDNTGCVRFVFPDSRLSIVELLNKIETSMATLNSVFGVNVTPFTKEIAIGKNTLDVIIEFECQREPLSTWVDNAARLGIVKYPNRKSVL